MPKRAKESFAFSAKDGAIIVVNSDDVYADDHPIVLAKPDHFRDISEDAVIGGGRGVEQATAAPGEKRGAPRK